MRWLFHGHTLQCSLLFSVWFLCGRGSGVTPETTRRKGDDPSCNVQFYIFIGCTGGYVGHSLAGRQNICGDDVDGFLRYCKPWQIWADGKECISCVQLRPQAKGSFT